MGAEVNTWTSTERFGRNRGERGLVQLSFGVVARRNTLVGVVVRVTCGQETVGRPVGV